MAATAMTRPSAAASTAAWVYGSDSRSSEGASTTPSGASPRKLQDCAGGAGARTQLDPWLEVGNLRQPSLGCPLICRRGDAPRGRRPQQAPRAEDSAAAVPRD